MDRPNGFWQGVVKPELERKVGQQLLSQDMMKKQPIRPIPDTNGGGESLPSHRFPTGERLRQIEHELSTTNAPRNGNGVALCWDYNSHNGCRLDSNPPNLAHAKMKADGIHRAVQAQLIRRGGLVGTKKIQPAEVDGSIPALRAPDIESKGGESKNLAIISMVGKTWAPLSQRIISWI